MMPGYDRGQNDGFGVLEYLVLMVVLMSAVIAFRFYVQHGYQGGMMRAAETFSFGRQYDPSDSLVCVYDDKLNVWYSEACYKHKVAEEKCGQKPDLGLGDPLRICEDQARRECYQGCQDMASGTACVANWFTTSVSVCTEACGGGTQILSQSDGCNGHREIEQPCNTQACDCKPNWVSDGKGYTACSNICGAKHSYTEIDGCGHSRKIVVDCPSEGCCTPNWHDVSYGTCYCAFPNSQEGLRDVKQEDDCGHTRTLTLQPCTNPACNANP